MRLRKRLRVEEAVEETKESEHQESENETKQSDRQDSDSEASDQYEVEKICGQRIIKKRKQYLVKWIGYDSKTWEPVCNLGGSKALIDAFHELDKSKTVTKPVRQVSPPENEASQEVSRNDIDSALKKGVY